MIVLITCAGSKDPRARSFVIGSSQVVFVADPASAPPRRGVVYACPDGRSPDGRTWRERLVERRSPGERFLPAWQLYSPPIYRELWKSFGKQLYILSAGWGLVRADRPLPTYDITFAAAAERWKRCNPRQVFADFCDLPQAIDELCYFGGRAYDPLFALLTADYPGRRRVFYLGKPGGADQRPSLVDCVLERHETRRSTNWHYECAEEFLGGRRTGASVTADETCQA